jgi:SPP1 gp7 family putative phage head morphogenesis protein
MVAAARRQARLATAAVRAVVKRTWPETTESQVRKAIVGALDRRAFVVSATRHLTLISRANHRQLASAITDFPQWDAKREGEEVRVEVAEMWSDLVDRLVGGGRKDAAREDGETTYLNSIMGRMRALRRTNAEILEVLEGLQQVAPAEELAAISRVRARVLGWESKRNEKHQTEAGIKRYTWVTKRDSRVRPDHVRLDGTIQRWSRPPVADTKSGFRAHPGGCKYCRCTADPIENRESQRRARRAAA